MQFQLADAVAILEKTPDTLNSLLRNLPEELVHAKEDESHWSAYDVVGHLIHGEETDWIPRARMIIDYGESHAFEPFDRFAMFEKSKGKNLSELLDTFASLRSESIQTLKDFDITPAKLELVGRHPSLGSVTLGQLLSTWVVHDLNHIAQITRAISKQYSEAIGPWKAYLSILSWTP